MGVSEFQKSRIPEIFVILVIFRLFPEAQAIPVVIKKMNNPAYKHAWMYSSKIIVSE